MRNKKDSDVAWWSTDGHCINEARAKNDVDDYIYQKLKIRLKEIISLPSTIVYQIKSFFKSEADKWSGKSILIERNSERLDFNEYSFYKSPQYNVVLGDPYHQHVEELQVVYNNAPQSLREIEETIGIEV